MGPVTSVEPMSHHSAKQHAEIFLRHAETLGAII